MDVIKYVLKKTAWLRTMPGGGTPNLLTNRIKGVYMEVNQIEKLFRAYVDFNIGLYESCAIKDICDRHNISCDSNYLYNNYVKEKLAKKLKEMFGDNLTFPKTHLHLLKRQIILKHLIEGEPLEPYFEVVEILNAHLSNDTMMNEFDDEEGWKQIVKTAIDISIVDSHKWAQPLEFYNKEFNEGSSAILLQEKGYKVQVNNCEITLDDTEYQRIATDIEKMVEHLGGHNVAEQIFNLLRPKFNKNRQRYRITREKSTLPSTSKPQIPYGYLLNVCVKHFAKLNHRDKVQFYKDLKQLIDLATAFASIMDIQEYSQYVDLFIGNENFVNYVYKNILFDSIIGIKQFNPHYVPKLIEGMLSPFFEEEHVKKCFGLPLTELIKVIDYILNKDTEKQSFRIVTIEEIIEAFPKINKFRLTNIMKFLSHNGTINQEYRNPTSISDFGKRPLIYKKNKYVLIDRTWCAISFYEAICDKLRPIVPSFDERLGYQLEDYIKAMLANKGIIYKSGFYGDEESDLIIETDDKIVLMEIKKKPLTRRASSGRGVNIFNDIAKGLLSSQIQLGKHELELLREGKITLRKFRNKKEAKKHPEQVVEHKGRIIERISLNAWDYGFLNDRMATQNVLQFLTYLEVHATESTEDEELNELRKLSKVLLNQFDELKKIDDRKRDNLRENYFDCSFFCLQQVIMIIDESNSTEDFVNKILLNKHVIMGTSDFYTEYDYLKGLKGK